MRAPPRPQPAGTELSLLRQRIPTRAERRRRFQGFWEKLELLAAVPRLPLLWWLLALLSHLWASYSAFTQTDTVVVVGMREWGLW